MQAGLLAGVGLALFGGPETASAVPICLMEGQCTFDKPLFLFALDYSTAMNAPYDQQKTRWQAVVAEVTRLIDAQNGYLPGNALIGVMRFGHDPDVAQPGTTIPGDTSGLVDGQRLDVAFYDANDPKQTYLECNGQAIKDALAAVPAPLGGQPQGIGAWTRGALLRAGAIFADVQLAHPNELPRERLVVVFTQGQWTDAAGAQVLAPPAEDPAPVAFDMYNEGVVPTFVVSVGDAIGTAAADALAAAGATSFSQPVGSDDLVDALQFFVEEVKDNIIEPVCGPSMPRIMLLLDASSSMLNVAGGTQAGGMGETPWDRVRGAVAGVDSAFDEPYENIQKFSAVVHVGAAVFGGAGEEKLIVDYGTGVCLHRLEWALDPNTSCGAGCTDPWGGPPIAWTFKDGSMVDPPGFPEKVLSHMPKCDELQPGQAFCAGSGSRVDLGLQLVRDNIEQYKLACVDPMSLEPCSEQTRYANIVITDGTYDATDAEVEAPLVQMHASGVTTYVVGFGAAADDPAAVEQWAKMAGWGSGGAKTHFTAQSQAELVAALATIVDGTLDGVVFDPCCSYSYQCNDVVDPSEGDPPPDESSGDVPGTTEPTTSEPDPVDSSTGGTGSTGGAVETTGEPATTGGAPTTGATTGDSTVGSASWGTGVGGTDGTGGTGGTAGETGEPGVMVSDGCACASGGEPGRFGTLLWLGLVGLARRRRAGSRGMPRGSSQ